jgi:hypothetical protein
VNDVLSLFDDPADLAPPPPPPVATCTCNRSRGEGEGFTNAGTADAQWWVHVGCRRPTPAYLAAMGGHRA